MEKIENLFETGNFDRKNIINKCSKIIPESVLKNIEANGVTLETLETLNVPVYKYKTQITLHGLFPQLLNNYLGGYKNLFQNKNLSIGIKWQAVDYEKKKYIFKTCKQYLNNWHIRHNSTDYFIYRISESLTNKDNYTTQLNKEKNYLNNIDKSLFYGNCGVYLSSNFGCYYLVTYINIGAVKTKNIDKVIENICQAKITDITAKIEDNRIKSEREKIERDEARKQAAIREQKLKQPLLEAARDILIKSGYQKVEKKDICNGDIFIKISTNIEDGTYTFNAWKFTKTKQQKKWRRITSFSNELAFEFDNYQREYCGNTCSGWILKPTEAINNKVEITQSNDINVLHNKDKNGVEISFKRKPEQQIINNLKANGFRWSSFNKIWYNRYSEHTYKFAQSLCK